MEFKTFYQWDDEIWKKVSPIYQQSFEGKGAKPKKILINMFKKRICHLHIISVGEDAIGMAITGKLSGERFLIIDYLAIKKDKRTQGVGRQLVEYIKKWSIKTNNIDALLIEVESGQTPENADRIQFWKQCGFYLTSYIHHYIWVPEPYQAMYLKLNPQTTMPDEGKKLFNYIERFHKASFTITPVTGTVHGHS